MRSSSLSSTRLPVLHLLGNLVNKMIPRVFAPRGVYCTHPVFRITYVLWIVCMRRRGGVRAYRARLDLGFVLGVRRRGALLLTKGRRPHVR
jgi:hypothetical protein